MFRVKELAPCIFTIATSCFPSPPDPLSHDFFVEAFFAAEIAIEQLLASVGEFGGQ
jgi:hypothetical protein